MIATDPLSLVFLACAVFAGAFLVLSSALGLGHAHGAHLGAHTATVHTAHVHVAAHAANGHVAANGHTANGAHQAGQHSAQSAPAAPPGQPSPLVALKDLFLGSINLYGILLFLLIFGLVGYLLHNSTSFGDVASLLVALLLAVVIALVFSAFLARFFLLDRPTVLDCESSRLEGRLAQVSMTIRVGGIGEIIYTGATGSRQSVGARSLDDEVIPVGDEVVILAYRDGIASVQPWDRFMASVHAGTAPALDPLDLPR